MCPNYLTTLQSILSFLTMNDNGQIILPTLSFCRFPSSIHPVHTLFPVLEGMREIRTVRGSLRYTSGCTFETFGVVNP